VCIPALGEARRALSHPAAYSADAATGLRVSAHSRCSRENLQVIRILRFLLRSHDDSESFPLFLEALRAVRYSFMRADTACRVACGIKGFLSRRPAAGFLGFAGPVVVRLDASSGSSAVDRFVAILPAARPGCGVGAISMPNIPERSSLSSTFAPAGPLYIIERSDPAFAINSC
jgi:hypothetical protein